jgi:outer membrane protein
MRFWILALVLMPSLSSAAIRLTWQECVQRASENNAELAAARQAVRAARSNEFKEEHTFFPQLSAGLSARRENNSLPEEGGFFGNDQLGPTSYGAHLTLNQNLFQGFETTGRVGVERAKADAAEENLRIVKARISYNLKASYQTYLLALENVRLTKDIIERQDSNVRLVELRFMSGREDRGSLLITKANLEQARYDHLLALNSVESTRLELARAIGVSETEEIIVEGTIPVSDPPPLGNLRDLAEDTPEYRQARANERGAEAGVLWARSGYFPRVDVYASGTKSGSEFFPGDPGNWAAGISISIPLFNGFRDSYAVSAARANVRLNESSRVNLGQSLMVKLRQSYSSYREAIQRDKVYASFLEAASLRSELGRAKYKNGLLNFEDWNAIESDLINRQKAKLQSQRDRVVAEAAWEQATGKGVIP